MKAVSIRIVTVAVLVTLSAIPLAASTPNQQPTNHWQQHFNEVYRLEEGQVLKRIAPPFIPERAEYYKYELKNQAAAIPESPGVLIFHWDGNLKNWGLSFGTGNSLAGVMGMALGFRTDQCEGADQLLKFQIPGDWIVRWPSSEEDRLKALEEILKNEMRKDIHFVKRTVDCEVIVATGTFEFRPLSGTYNSKWVHFFSDTLDPDESSGGGTADSVPDLLNVLGNLTGMQVIYEALPSEQKNLAYGHHNSAYIRRIDDPAEKIRKLELLLANLSEQINLSFRIKTRPVEKWFVEEPNSLYEGQNLNKQPVPDPNSVSTEQNIALQSAKRLNSLAKHLAVYANDHNERFPDNFEQLKNVDVNDTDIQWLQENIEYLGAGKPVTVPANEVIAYDKTLLEKVKKTNVLYADTSVESVTAERLKHELQGPTK